MNMKICIVLLGVCVAMAAGRSLDREVLRKLILERLNELNEVEMARKDLGRGIHKKMLLGKPTGAGDPFQTAMNALRSAIFNYEDVFGTKEASSLTSNLARIVGGIASVATAVESSDNESTESTTSTENPTTTTEGTDSTTTSTTASTTSIATSTASTTTTASPATSTTATPDAKRILQQLLRELNIRRK